MIKAIIFDFDGIITDSEPVHLKMFQQVLSELNISISRQEYYETYLGMDDKGCFTTVLKAHGLDASHEVVQALIDKKAKSMMEYLEKSVFIYPGVTDFVNKAKDRFRLAIASGALRHEIEYVLQMAGISSAFDLIVSAEDVMYGKPDPECFNKALERLNDHSVLHLTPGECVVIEDSIAGIEGAIAAGMKCIAVTNTYDSGRLTMAGSIVKGLSEIDVEKLDGLFR
ncbi:MAG: HAD family phosphatase [Nitrospira sp.]|nr:HAD family phosphatase [Nitrospira sp.]